MFYTYTYTSSDLNHLNPKSPSQFGKPRQIHSTQDGSAKMSVIFAQDIHARPASRRPLCVLKACRDE